MPGCFKDVTDVTDVTYHLHLATGAPLYATGLNLLPGSRLLTRSTHSAGPDVLSCLMHNVRAVAGVSVGSESANSSVNNGADGAAAYAIAVLFVAKLRARWRARLMADLDELDSELVDDGAGGLHQPARGVTRGRSPSSEGSSDVPSSSDGGVPCASLPRPPHSTAKRRTAEGIRAGFLLR